MVFRVGRCSCIDFRGGFVCETILIIPHPHDAHGHLAALVPLVLAALLSVLSLRRPRNKIYAIVGGVEYLPLLGALPLPLISVESKLVLVVPLWIAFCGHALE